MLGGLTLAQADRGRGVAVGGVDSSPTSTRCSRSCTCTTVSSCTAGSQPGADLSQAPQASVPAPATAMIRTDLDVPVFVFETETDVINSNLADRQPDTAKFRLWEVAGTSHYDDYGLAIGPGDTGNGKGAVQNLAAMQHPPRTITMTVPIKISFTCNLAINTGGAHWVLDAAVYWLNQWVVNGTLPPHGPLMKTTGVSPVDVRVRRERQRRSVAYGRRKSTRRSRRSAVSGTTAPVRSEASASSSGRRSPSAPRSWRASTRTTRCSSHAGVKPRRRRSKADSCAQRTRSSSTRRHPPLTSESRGPTTAEDGLGDPVAGHAAEDEALRDDGLGVGGHRSPTLRSSADSTRSPSKTSRPKRRSPCGPSIATFPARKTSSSSRSPDEAPGSASRSPPGRSTSRPMHALRLALAEQIASEDADPASTLDRRDRRPRRASSKGCSAASN